MLKSLYRLDRCGDPRPLGRGGFVRGAVGGVELAELLEVRHLERAEVVALGAEWALQRGRCGRGGTLAC